MTSKLVINMLKSNHYDINSLMLTLTEDKRDILINKLRKKEEEIFNEIGVPMYLYDHNIWYTSKEIKEAEIFSLKAKIKEQQFLLDGIITREVEPRRKKISELKEKLAKLNK